ncbi:SdrD B-like domain-containing protein [Actinokineospora soli]|uniref:SdrD B-like domain-containing protein n=1 Tax=Actinokineospora soli TaxID=1048753 RepID=A0ABW2TPA7_9PSEU
MQFQHPGPTCAPSQVHYRPIVNAFSDDDHGDPIRLRSLAFGSGFIALACGNFSAGGAASPVPVISGHKFHDHDRDGVRDAGEPGLAGWTMTLHRDRSDAGQALGGVATAVTNADGYYEFRLDGHYPGDYAVTEEDRADWARTTSPHRHTLRVGPGIGAPHFAGLDFGNVETRADAVKVSFSVVDPPTEVPADAETALRVRAVLENRGPAPVVDVVDRITASGPADCAFRPAEQAVTRRLLLNRPVEVVFDVGVTCTEPSFHPLEFANALTVTTPGVTDPDQASNHRVTGATIAVIDESDVAVTGTRLDCAARTYVDDRFTCTTTALITNHGDHAPASADVDLALTGPADCVLTPTGATAHEVSVTDQVQVSTTWDVVCGDRSYHDFRTTAQVRLDHLHVIDPDPGNGNGAADDRVEVFEPVDLAVTDLRITCDEREHRTRDVTCVSTVTIANAGPATDVRTLTTVGFTAPADCSVVPGAPQQRSHVLAAGTTATFTATWQLTCDPPRRRTFATTATIAADEPHPEDVNRANDTRSITWQPIDVKPRSYPSAVNIGKEGIVPVAILSTAELDAVAQIDRLSPTFGATGTEASLVRCATVGEDVNGDGLLDLVCHFDTARTALTCGSTTATLMARTLDGRRVEGQDDVKVTGC